MAKRGRTVTEVASEMICIKSSTWSPALRKHWVVTVAVAGGRTEIREKKQKRNTQVSMESLPPALSTFKSPSLSKFALSLLGDVMGWTDLPPFTDGETKAQRVKTLPS